MTAHASTLYLCLHLVHRFCLHISDPVALSFVRVGCNIIAGFSLAVCLVPRLSVCCNWLYTLYYCDGIIWSQGGNFDSRPSKTSCFLFIVHPSGAVFVYFSPPLAVTACLPSWESHVTSCDVPSHLRRLPWRPSIKRLFVYGGQPIIIRTWLPRCPLAMTPDNAPCPHRVALAVGYSIKSF